MFLFALAGSVCAELADYTDREASFEQDAFLFSETNNLKARFFDEIARSCVDVECSKYEDACVKWNKFKDECYGSGKICSLPSCKKYKIYCELVIINQDEKSLDAAFDAYYVTADGVKHLVEKMSYNIEQGHGWPFVWTYEASTDNIGHCEHSLVPIKKSNESGGGYSHSAYSPWPMFHGDARHTGLSPYDTSNVDGTLKWAFDTNGAGIESSPVIGKDGTIYFGAHDNKFYAVNPDGTLKWKFDAGEPIYSEKWGDWFGITSSPAIDTKGIIYFVSLSNHLYALNPDGSEAWSYPVHDYLNVWLAPVIGSDGTIYVGSESYPPGDDVKTEIGGNFYAINPDGTLKWKYESNSSGFGNGAVIGSDGTIYAPGGDFDPKINTYSSKVFAFDPEGKVKWKFDPDGVAEGSPSIGSDGTIYIGVKERDNPKKGKFFAITKDGKEKWRFSDISGMMATPAIGKDGTIYFGDWNGVFYALDANGKEKWRFITPEGFETLSSSPAIGADGAVYFGHTQAGFYALTPEGMLKWNNSKFGGIVSSPAIGTDGTIYVGSWNNKLYAISGAGEGISLDSLEETNNLNKEEPPEKCVIDGEFIGEDKCKALIDKGHIKEQDNDPPEKCTINGRFIGRERCEALMQGKINETEHRENVKRSFLQGVIAWFASLFK